MKVSDLSQSLFMKLIAWECFGDMDVNPKHLLRMIPITDLLAVASNIKGDAQFQDLTCASMVELEVLFKQGLLRGDWSLLQENEKVSLSYEPISLPEQGMEHITHLGARA